MNIVTWVVRIILLFVLALGATILFFVVKDTLKELKHGSR